jgi:hypothetical protein
MTVFLISGLVLFGAKHSSDSSITCVLVAGGVFRWTMATARGVWGSMCIRNVVLFMYLKEAPWRWWWRYINECLY